MKSKFQKIKGTYDILPPESKKWNTAVSILQSLSEQFGYEEIKTPIIENIDLKKFNILREELNKAGLSLIKLVAPTTDDNRLKDIVKISNGFLYQVNVAGVTGVKSANQTDVESFIKRIQN